MKDQQNHWESDISIVILGCCIGWSDKKFGMNSSTTIEVEVRQNNSSLQQTRISDSRYCILHDDRAVSRPTAENSTRSQVIGSAGGVVTTT